jgi:hypothetical protein
MIAKKFFRGINADTEPILTGMKFPEGFLDCVSVSHVIVSTMNESKYKRMTANDVYNRD